MTQALFASIEKTCPACGTANRIFTTEFRPHWKINCSKCGGAIANRPALRSVQVQTTPLSIVAPRKAG